ncbi:hypothetical protein [Niallia endozanthoxylica]|uniref:Uncharacterized protein n=1 Tax=Niallia endozanthoxylica TaxID=2036016 RepID=A0A5J5H8R0_9BACI|nr:hypothetical protein [Niallia endozanthoxylica]KAA9016991.1 hypothetical protein F4V44_21210 [Niallia endozanthoxylica]
MIPIVAMRVALIQIGGNKKMWVITVFAGQNVTMYEFESENEARERIQSLEGYTVLSNVVYYNEKLQLQFN